MTNSYLKSKIFKEAHRRARKTYDTRKSVGENARYSWYFCKYLRDIYSEARQLKRNIELALMVENGETTQYIQNLEHEIMRMECMERLNHNQRLELQKMKDDLSNKKSELGK